MFYLRKIDKESRVVSNHGLGDTYMTEHKDVINNCEGLGTFEKKVDKVCEWMQDSVKARVYALVYDEHGKVTPIFYESDNYIMTENGKTFERL